MKDYESFFNNILQDVNVKSIFKDNIIILYNNINNNSFLFFESEVFFNKVNCYHSFLLSIYDYFLNIVLYGYEFEKIRERLKKEVECVDDIVLYNELNEMCFDS